MEWKHVVIQPFAKKKEYLQIDENGFLKFDRVKANASGTVQHELVQPSAAAAQSSNGNKKGKSRAEAEPSKSCGLVHMKCCETGRYWTVAGDSNRIAAWAFGPAEDKCSAACTLIKYSHQGERDQDHKYMDFQILSERGWLPIVDKDGYLATGEDVPDDFIVADWRKFG